MAGQMDFFFSSRPIVWVTLLVLATILVYRRWKARIAQQEDERFASAKGCAAAPVWASQAPLGLDLLVRAFWHGRDRTVCEFFTEISEISKPTHEQLLLGQSNIGTTDPENLEAVLTKQFEDFNLGFRIPQFRDLLGSSVITQEGSAWKHSRELLRPLFSSNKFHNFEDVRKCVDQMLDKVTPDVTIDLQPLIFQLTLDTALFMIFGETAAKMQMSDENMSRRRELANAANTAQEYLAYRTRVGDFHWLINGPPMWRACKTVHSFVDAAVIEALNAKEERKDQISEGTRYVFIDALIEQTRDPQILRDQCLTLMFAGRDSTACCISWALRLLARHPNVLAKVRKEVAFTVGIGQEAQQPTREQLKQMSYLNCVIKETLRLYPSVPLNQKAASKTTTIPKGGGADGQSPVVVHKGESVGYCVYAMHRRKDIYGADAREFRPERWENDALKGVGYGYLPFGAGPRACLGQEFALSEAKYTVARLVQRYPYMVVAEGQTLEIGKEKQMLTLVLSSAEGCCLRLSERDDV